MLVFPKDEIEYALFSGVEQEGQLRGIYTLYVVGDVPWSIIDEAISNGRFYQHVYFGAGGRFEYNPAVVQQLTEDLPGMDITIESPNFDERLWSESRCFWIIPYIWGGQVLTQGLLSLQHAGKYKNDRVFAKIDNGGDMVMIHRVSDAQVITDFGGYGYDKLVTQKRYENQASEE